MDLKSRMKLEKMAYATEQTTLKATKFLQTVDKYASAVDNLHAYTIILKEICKNKKAMEIWQQIESQHDIYTSLLKERETKNIDEKLLQKHGKKCCVQLNNCVKLLENNVKKNWVAKFRN